jgi:hypothetical protein
VDELDANILPLYEKYNIKHDIFTFQFLGKLYLNMAEYDMVKSLYKNLKDENIEENQSFLDAVLEASMRTDDADMVYDAMTDFIKIKREPHKRLLGKLNNMLHMPDRLYVLLKEHFGWSGQMTQNIRKFEKPSFGDQYASKLSTPKGLTGKRYKLKKMS